MLRVIREVQPTWVVGENVFGLINWNGGLVFDEVQTDLEDEGYEVQPYVLPACGVNAPHKRDRVWFIAHRANTGIKEMQYRGENGIYGFKTTSNTNDQRLQGGKQAEGSCINKNRIRRSRKQRYSLRSKTSDISYDRITSNSESQQSERMQLDERESCQSKQRESGRMGCESITGSDVTNSNSGRQSSEEHGQDKSGWLTENSISNDWEDFPTQSPVCDGNDGLSSRLVGITFSNWRNESIKAMGNAIVPQVALEIFKVIQQMSK